jgi:hypothetical protein
MITVDLTRDEAQAVADTLCAWRTGVNYLGPTNTEALRRASNKLTAAIDKAA